MENSHTARHSLPFLFVTQAQKELTHNEALARIDALLHPVVEAQLAAPPAPTSMDDGKCWLIADSATGGWSGKSGQIARWSGGSWRYLEPVQGMSLINMADGKRCFYISGQWIASNAIPDPAGGTVIDVEARAAIAAILGHLRQIQTIP
ncbi:MAG: hypothetical protein RL481_61 [Pseudomonadota bacterium]